MKYSTATSEQNSALTLEDNTTTADEDENIRSTGQYRTGGSFLKSEIRRDPRALVGWSQSLMWNFQSGHCLTFPRHWGTGGTKNRAAQTRSRPLLCRGPLRRRRSKVGWCGRRRRRKRRSGSALYLPRYLGIYPGIQYTHHSEGRRDTGPNFPGARLPVCLTRAEAESFSPRSSLGELDLRQDIKKTHLYRAAAPNITTSPDLRNPFDIFRCEGRPPSSATGARSNNQT